VYFATANRFLSMDAPEKCEKLKKMVLKNVKFEEKWS
jgi:hypothetical protein